MTTFGAVLESHAHITVTQLSQTPTDANVAEIQNYAIIAANVDRKSAAMKMLIMYLMQSGYGRLHRA